MEKTHVSLRLMSDDKSPDEIFAALGVPADKSWRKGEPRGKASPIGKENGYEFRTDQPGEMSIEEQAYALLRRVDPFADKIRALRCSHVQLTCAVYSSRVPPIHFSSSVIEKLSHLSASIDVDLYVADGNWSE